MSFYRRIGDVIFRAKIWLPHGYASLVPYAPFPLEFRTLPYQNQHFMSILIILCVKYLCIFVNFNVFNIQLITVKYNIIINPFQEIQISFYFRALDQFYGILEFSQQVSIKSNSKHSKKWQSFNIHYMCVNNITFNIHAGIKVFVFYITVIKRRQYISTKT